MEWFLILECYKSKKVLKSYFYFFFFFFFKYCYLIFPQNKDFKIIHFHIFKSSHPHIPKFPHPQIITLKHYLIPKLHPFLRRRKNRKIDVTVWV